MKRPYICHQDADTILWCGRWEDVLPKLSANSVDLTIADPPYGVEWQSRRRATLFDPIVGDDGSFDGIGLIRECGRVSKRGRHIYVFGLDTFGPLLESGLIGGETDLVWDKEMIGSGDLAIPWAPSHERILFGVYVRSKVNTDKGDGRLAARLRRGSVLRHARPNASAVTRHPTEKPVGLLRELIESSSRIGETVLDPCAGSGSTLEAARLEGRKGIGIEVDEAYCRAIVDRLRQRSMPLFGGAPRDAE